jgi:hypothetical protein
MAAMLHQNPFSFSKKNKTTVDIIEDNKVLYLVVKEKDVVVSVSITQLAWTCIVICRDRGSNPGHPIYSS